MHGIIENFLPRRNENYSDYNLDYLVLLGNMPQSAVFLKYKNSLMKCSDCINNWKSILSWSPKRRSINYAERRMNGQLGSQELVKFRGPCTWVRTWEKITQRSIIQPPRTQVTRQANIQPRNAMWPPSFVVAMTWAQEHYPTTGSACVTRLCVTRTEST